MDEPEKLLFFNDQSPGDVLMLTAALRDLHKTYPNRFITGVKTSCMPLWENNPYVTTLPEHDPVKVVHCKYPLIQTSNNRPEHFLHGFVDYLNKGLQLSIELTEFRGDLYLSEEERSATCPVELYAGTSMPFWIIVSGGKWDFTIKWWDHSRFQKVVDALVGKVLFVQVGDKRHFHPPLKNVIDLRGKTSLRDYIVLTYLSQGVLCPVTSAMHLAAAVPMRPGAGTLRPCVVVAGGREPPHWEAYPGHQYIHTVGMLPCCGAGGCWKCRTVPLNDGRPYDAPVALCSNVVHGILPKCMDMITPEDVIRRMEGYFTGGMARYLTREEVKILRAAGIWS